MEALGKGGAGKQGFFPGEGFGKPVGGLRGEGLKAGGEAGFGVFHVADHLKKAAVGIRTVELHGVEILRRGPAFRQGIIIGREHEVRRRPPYGGAICG